MWSQGPPETSLKAPFPSAVTFCGPGLWDLSVFLEGHNSTLSCLHCVRDLSTDDMGLTR